MGVAPRMAGGSFNPNKLWSNTTTSFAAQTVKINDLKSYKWLIIAYAPSGLSPLQYMLVKNSPGDLIYLQTSTDTMHYRTVTINENALIFGDDYYYTSYNSSVTKAANTHTVPVAVYGIR